ncbi:MAG: efflux RND transporter periplasmic adaptor subunit [Arenimonas sp.]
MRKTKLVIGFSVSLLSAAALTACSGGGQQGMPPPPQVNVAQVVQKKVKLWDEFSGRIEAVDTVELRPRVAGYLSSVHFREGSEVSRGQLLFSIDDREYRAAVGSARANLARAQSRVALARTELARSERLIKEQATSQGELDQRRGELQQAQADLGSMQAAVTQAELNLNFTKITSPINGRIGAALVKPGNLVSPGSSLLSTVVTMDPIYVTFEGDEQVYLKYQTMSQNGERKSSRDVRNPVLVGLANETGYPHKGEMVFVDNRLNPGTGTIRAKAELSNADGVFTPGLYARVRLLGSGEQTVMLIHEMAVSTDQDRKFVYVLGEKNATVRKDVVLGESVDGLRVVRKGLDPKDIVVVNGVRKIFFPGAPVEPITVPMDKPDQAPPAPANPAAPAGH